MVRPNQIVSKDESELSFIMFARSEDQVKRRVLMLNFPYAYFSDILMGDLETSDVITKVELLMESNVNRYVVTVDVDEI